MLWVTDHFSCIYFCQNWPAQRTVSFGLPWGCPPWHHQGSLVWPQQAGWEMLYLCWVEKSVLLRCGWHSTQSSLPLRGRLHGGSCRGEPAGWPAFSAVTARRSPPPVPLLRAERNADRAALVLEKARDRQNAWQKELCQWGPTGETPQVGPSKGTLAPGPSVPPSGGQFFSPALLLLSPKPTFCQFPDAEGLGWMNSVPFHISPSVFPRHPPASAGPLPVHFMSI